MAERTNRSSLELPEILHLMSAAIQVFFETVQDRKVDGHVRVVAAKHLMDGCMAYLAALDQVDVGRRQAQLERSIAQLRDDLEQP
jgi:hypothetical protein